MSGKLSLQCMSQLSVIHSEDTSSAVVFFVFIALPGFSALLKIFAVFFLPGIYCKLNLSPDCPFRNTEYLCLW